MNTDARLAAAASRYWAAGSREEERRAYAEMLSLGAPPAYGESREEAARLVASYGLAMTDGPRPRAADDADAILKAMREIYDREGRRPIACPPGQHNFQWSHGGVYTCAACGRGRHEDGR